jgi:hypothetical protein
VDLGGFEGGPDRVPLASKVSVALHMGQTRGPAFLAFKWVANLAYLPVSSILSPLAKNLRGILTDFPLGMNDRYGGLPTGLLVPVVSPLATREPRGLRPRAFGPGPDGLEIPRGGEDRPVTMGGSGLLLLGARAASFVS